VAPESAVAAFGSSLATQVQAATTFDLPVTLAGSSVAVRDAAGVLRLAPLFYAGPGQINYQMPAAAAPGNATITVATASGTTASGTVQIANVAPGIFTANGNGAGVPAATAIRVTPEGTQVPVNVFQCAASGCTPAPIELAAGDRLFLTLYGTGIRKRSSLDAVRCTIGGVDAPVLFAGAQGTFVGLDQINVEAPASLRGRGEVSLVLTVDGLAANPVTINIR
jgi:uncharacterized protein (TIGR03437 family)